VDPTRYVPVFFWYYLCLLERASRDIETIICLCVGEGTRYPLEFVFKGFVVEEYPGILEFPIERFLQLSHTLCHVSQLAIPHQCDYRSFAPCTIVFLGINERLVFGRGEVVVIFLCRFDQVMFGLSTAKHEDTECDGGCDKDKEGEDNSWS